MIRMTEVGKKKREMEEVGQERNRGTYFEKTTGGWLKEQTDQQKTKRVIPNKKNHVGERHRKGVGVEGKKNDLQSAGLPADPPRET